MRMRTFVVYAVIATVCAFAYTKEATTSPIVDLAVPFTAQAPTANWDVFHEHACEEASLLMVHRFYEGDKPGVMESEMVEHELRAMTAWEDKTFGYNADTTVAEMGVVAKGLYGYAVVKELKDPTVDQLKQELAAGHPIIVPAAGQQLGNPYFSAPGPVYHMLVLRGYTKDGFITNDPGTRRGAGLMYPFDRLMKAVHDWDKEDILKGAKAVLVVYPNKK